MAKLAALVLALYLIALMTGVSLGGYVHVLPAVSIIMLFVSIVLGRAASNEVAHLNR